MPGAAPSRPNDFYPANNRADINRVEDAILQAIATHGYSEPAKFAIRLALEEGLVNAFMHGHRGLPATETVHVHFDATPEQVTIVITDKGPGFKPEHVPDPTLDENVELPSGRGLMLIRAYMSEVRHEAPGNRLVMVYKRQD
jgi:serine/threonine-protein kinase RsbW